jgi:hypothetical protein
MRKHFNRAAARFFLNKPFALFVDFDVGHDKGRGRQIVPDFLDLLFFLNHRLFVMVGEDLVHQFNLLRFRFQLFVANHF